MTMNEKILGTKDDLGKEDWTLVPWDAMREVVRVLMFGAQKYGRGNWRHVKQPAERYSAAAMRHIVARQLGETADAETNLSPLAHAICCLLFMIELEGTPEPTELTALGTPRKRARGVCGWQGCQKPARGPRYSARCGRAHQRAWRKANT